MATENLGRVGFVNKQDWVDGLHKINDVVKYEESVYACLIEHTSTGGDILPTDKTYWQLWVEASKVLSSVTYQIGTGGNFATLNEAFLYVSKRTPIYNQAGVTVTLNLMSGFVLQEQVRLYGLNLAFVTITSDDDVVTIARSYLTNNYGGTVYPAFYLTGTLGPTIIVQFFMDSTGDATNREGMRLADFSTVKVIGGFSNCGSYGVACFSSKAALNSGEYSNNGNTGVYMTLGSAVVIDSATVSNNASAGVGAYYGSTLNVINSTEMRDNTGVRCVDIGASHCAIGANVSISGSTVGVRGIEGARINAINCTQIYGDGTAFYCASGAQMVLMGTMESVNLTPNTLTSAGIVYR